LCNSAVGTKLGSLDLEARQQAELHRLAGQHPEHDDAGDRLTLRSACDRLAKRIERRGADIPEHHPDTSQRQGPKARRDRPVPGFGRCDADSHDDRKTFYRWI
jgi:hypothetical protein